MDSADSPHIGYRENYAYDLKYARWTGSAWDIQTVDSTGYVGVSPSLALDSAGNPHISYYDNTNDDLKYAFGTMPVFGYLPIVLKEYNPLATPIPTFTPEPTATSGPTSTPRPATSTPSVQPQQGHWWGKAASDPYYCVDFEVSYQGGSLVVMNGDIKVPGSTGAVWCQQTGTSTITNGKFSDDWEVCHVTGTFTSSSHASGSWQAENFGTWSAQPSVASCP